MLQHVDVSCSCAGKFCPACDQLKCHGAFYKNPKGRQGLGSKCRQCCKERYLELQRESKLEKKIEVPIFQHFDVDCGCEGKYCRTCQQWQCQKAFSRDAKGANGLSARCKVCVKSYQQAHIDRINERRKENRHEKSDHYNAVHRAYHHKHPEKKRASDRKHRQKNLAYLQEINKAYRMEKKNDKAYMERRKKYNQEYIRLHPEKSAQYFNNRRARVEQAEGSFTSKEWKNLCKHYNYTCLCCKRREPEIKLTVDHVIPLSASGSNFITNIQPLCQSCNFTKQVKIIDYRIDWA